MNSAILFLYEGETEGEFYPKIFKSKLTLQNREIRISQKCLSGNFNINVKVVNAIYDYQGQLSDKNNNADYAIHVFIALDRDKRKEFKAPIDVKWINDNIGSNAVKTVNLIIATQDFESWLFIDIENIFKFLKAPKSKRNVGKYKNHESFNNKDLSKLFSQHKKIYRKGKKVEGLLNALDLLSIYDKCTDLKNGVKLMQDIINKNKNI